MVSRHVAFVTGARSEYDILFPVARASRSLLSPLFIAGAGHLSPAHGMTIDLIRDDGFDVRSIHSLLASDTWEARALSFTQFHDGLCRLLAELQPDLLVVAGDREEALAGALAGNFLRI